MKLCVSAGCVLTAQIEYQLVSFQVALEQLARVEVRIYRRIRHHDVLLLGTYWILVHKASRIFHVKING